MKAITIILFALLAFADSKLKSKAKLKNDDPLDGIDEDVNECSIIKGRDECIEKDGCCWRTLSFKDEIPDKLKNKTDLFNACNKHSRLLLEKAAIDIGYMTKKKEYDYVCSFAGKMTLGFSLLLLLLFL